MAAQVYNISAVQSSLSTDVHCLDLKGGLIQESSSGWLQWIHWGTRGHLSCPPSALPLSVRLLRQQGGGRGDSCDKDEE